MTNTPTIDTLAPYLAYDEPTTDETADAARSLEAKLRAEGGGLWAYYGVRRVRVYNLAPLDLGDAWNGVVTALGDEVLALERGVPVVYLPEATPLVPSVPPTVHELTSDDFDTYLEADGIRVVFHDPHSHARIEVRLTDAGAQGVAEEIAYCLTRRADVRPVHANGDENR